VGKSFGVVNFVSLLFVIALFMGYISYVGKERDEIERLKLSYAIDYASDAGTQAMLQTADLDMDYTKEKYFRVNPQLALDTFIDVFCFNYGMYPTEFNRATVKDFIPVAAVAAYDGYYIATQELVRSAVNHPESPARDGDWDLVFSMKKPYRYSPTPTSNIHYALNMGLRDTLTLTEDQLYRIEGLPPTSNGTMSRQEARALINTTISNDMAYQINSTNEENPNWKNIFFIPNQLTTFGGVNPIEGPSLLVLVQGVNLSSTKPISGFSISGTSVEARRMVVGYQLSGTKYYAFADRVPSNADIQEMFYTINEAAEAGYFADVKSLAKSG